MWRPRHPVLSGAAASLQTLAENHVPLWIDGVSHAPGRPVRISPPSDGRAGGCLRGDRTGAFEALHGVAINAVMDARPSAAAPWSVEADVLRPAREAAGLRRA